MGRNNVHKNEKLRNSLSGVGAERVADYLETKTQISKYHTKGGHGFAAEDALTLIDKLQGKNAYVVGRDNAPNGPDRIVNGQAIQTKYYQTPQQTINSAFDAETGMFRYTGQKLEVPADQYEECVRLMEQKIREGKVPGVNDPAKAKDIVKKGKLTYKQAVNIAKAGTVESIIYDATQQAIVCTHVFGLSFCASFALAFWKTGDLEEATKFAIKQASAVAGTSFVAGIITSQILRTKTAAMGTVVVRHGVKGIAKTSLGKKAVEQIAKASLGKSIHGAAAINHVSKLLRSNAITAVVTTVVITAPDFYRALISKTVTWEQAFKNLAVNASSVGGGVAGWMAGAAVGSAIFPGVGTIVGGLIGGIAGGMVAYKGAKAIADEIVEDDIVKMQRILEEALQDAGVNYLLNEEEFKQLLTRLVDKIKDKEDWFKVMVKKYREFGREDAYKYAYKECENICDDIIKQRSKIKLPDGEEIIRVLSDVETTSEQG